MKKTGIVLISIGFVLVLFSVLGDLLQGENLDIGAAQVSGILLGVIVILAGIGCVTIKAESTSHVRAHVYSCFQGLQLLPPVFWVFFTFLLIYMAFFLFPVFLNSKHEIHYISGYIPEQGRLGFDIRSVVNRINDWYTGGISPYADGFIAYPPLAILLFSPLVLLGYPVYFQVITIITLICFIICSLLLPVAVTGRGGIYLAGFLFFTGLFSYGVQFELERGQFNVIAFTLCMLAIYIYYYAGDEFNGWAYFLFTVSVQMKIYPVFFAVMFIKDWRDWKSNIKQLTGLAILNLLPLFVLGRHMFMDFWRMVNAYQIEYESNRHETLSIKGFVHSLAGGDIGRLPEGVLSAITKYASLIEIGFYVVLGLCLLSTILHQGLNKPNRLNPYLLFVCTIGALIVPSVSNDYKLSILVAPMVIVLATVCLTPESSIKNSVKLLIGIASMAYWSTLYPFDVKPDLLSRNFPALVILLISVTAISLVLRNNGITSGKVA